MVSNGAEDFRSGSRTPPGARDAGQARPRVLAGTAVVPPPVSAPGCGGPRATSRVPALPAGPARPMSPPLHRGPAPADRAGTE
ncbi:hypothetical protein GCM10023079_15160 [Streptomyces chitinivorans]